MTSLSHWLAFVTASLLIAIAPGPGMANIVGHAISSTTAPIHAPFEGALVHDFIDFGVVYGQVRPYTDRSVGTIEQRVPLYLAETLSQVAPTYVSAQASGNDNYQTAKPAEIAIVMRQLAAGVAELRDEIVDAWHRSEQIAIGYPLVRVSDVESHAVPMTTTTLASD